MSGAPSLQQLCIAGIEKLITLRNVLSFLDFTQQERELCGCYPSLEAAARRIISQTFEALCEIEGPEVVEASISSFTELLEKALRRNEEVRAFKSLIGRVLEREQPTISEVVQQTSAHVAASTAGTERHYYPHETLKKGCAWPPDVVPHKREQHLVEDQFESIFGMSTTAFAALPGWRQQQLKKNVALF